MLHLVCFKTKAFLGQKKYSIAELVFFTRFIKHAQTPHSILMQFLDRGFSGWQAQNWASDVLCPTNSTDSSAIYKMRHRVADSINLPEINNVCYISVEIT